MIDLTKALTTVSASIALAGPIAWVSDTATTAPTTSAPSTPAQPRGIPLCNYTCGSGIRVRADEGGPVFVDGKQTTLEKCNDNHCEATEPESGVTVSIALSVGGPPNVSCTARHGVNGVCRSS